jgi:dihydroneopterin aldolase
MMNDPAGTLRLKNLVFWGRHGHHAFERESGNRFEVDVELNLSNIGATDALESTVDLDFVYTVVRRFVEGDPCILIETLAHLIASELVKLEKVQSCTARVRKTFPPLEGATSGVMEAEITCVS